MIGSEGDFYRMLDPLRPKSTSSTLDFRELATDFQWWQKIPPLFPHLKLITRKQTVRLTDFTILRGAAESTNAISSCHLHTSGN